MQDRPNNKEDDFLELNSAQKVNLPLTSLNKDPFTCPHFKAKFPKFN